jgi:plasmid stabilization system protein ParE
VKVVLSRRALGDLTAIGQFIAADNPSRAKSFVDELQAVAQRLVVTPRGFPLVPRLEERGIRRRSWKGYGIYYAIEGQVILVLHILGPGQDHDRRLGLK